MLGAVLYITSQLFSTEGLHRNGWTMETPNIVMGKEGKPVVLFCKFTHLHGGYGGNITVSWREDQTGKWILNYTNFPSDNGFANEIRENEGERYQPMGNPRQNDASIIIKRLRPQDHHMRYVCLVDLQEDGNPTSQSFSQTLLVVTGDDVSVSIVIGKKGSSATLPCSFSPSNRKPSSITIRWMKGNPREESTVFIHTHPHTEGPPYLVTENGGGRYELVGKLDQGDASIRMKGLRMDDGSDYFCHVWIMNSTQETVTQDGMKLEVVVPATILELYVASDNVTGEDTLVCRAEGTPPAKITWIGPGNSALPVNNSEMRVTHDPEKLQTVGELLHLGLRKCYMCVAVNEHGRDTSEVNLSTKDNSRANFIIGMLCLLPLIKFLLLLITGIILFIKIKDS
ncbi:sialic acid-binding Ig-like lectin 15 isoform X2 [Leucoraja erinacea]|uniref:sialic acid-binding Ig-like lectin 15 isoform X2 n=1 Tax=Leucoraja erinaceus TaxID=7782 RepID=UPI002457FCF0|nr:sialic acid-binding Ig-like lectin 15 isoform X2 [Leucoraja erinacea]